MSARTRVLVLLSSLMVFLAAAAVVALSVRARAGEGLARVAGRDVPLLALATDVASDHLEQHIRLERMLRHSRDRAHSAEAQASYAAARSEYEAYTAAIWHRLQEAREVASAAETSGDARAGALLDRIDRIDAAHNVYAERVREASALLESGRRREALHAVERVTSGEERLARVLGLLLDDAAASAEAAAAQAQREEWVASRVVWGLIAIGLAAAAWVFVSVVRLVSEMRTLSGLLPICAHCKKIRDDGGYWNQLEAYVEAHSEAAFTHGICADCQETLHGKVARARAPENAPAV